MFCFVKKKELFTMNYNNYKELVNKYTNKHLIIYYDKS